MVYQTDKLAQSLRAALKEKRKKSFSTLSYALQFYNIRSGWFKIRKKHFLLNYICLFNSQHYEHSHQNTGSNHF